MSDAAAPSDASPENDNLPASSSPASENDAFAEAPAGAVWKLTFYGVRGSVPVCDAGYAEFGGDTTCFHLDVAHKPEGKHVHVVFDAGTGIRQLGKDVMAGRYGDSDQVLLHFSHFHWDHIQGLPFFAPVYVPDQQIAFYSPHHTVSSGEAFRDVMAQQMQPTFFPVQLERMGAQMGFHTDKAFMDHFALDPDVSVRHHLNPHPGGAYSFRLDGYGRSVAIVTDYEHGETVNEDLVEFVRGVDLLVHEAQYTDAQLEERRGWGHSSYGQAIEVAERADARQPYFTHHDPDHDDAFLREVEVECQRRFPNCAMARQGSVAWG